MKKKLLSIAILIIPALFFLNVWQSFRYQTLKRETEMLYRRQLDLIEENKRIIASISLLRSPDRIGLLAEEDLELEGIYPDDILYLDSSEEKEELDEQ
jgi:hypothetical protein